MFSLPQQIYTVVSDGPGFLLKRSLPIINSMAADTARHLHGSLTLQDCSQGLGACGCGLKDGGVEAMRAFRQVGGVSVCVCLCLGWGRGVGEGGSKQSVLYTGLLIWFYLCEIVYNVQKIIHFAVSLFETITLLFYCCFLFLVEHLFFLCFTHVFSYYLTQQIKYIRASPTHRELQSSR